MSKPKRQEDYYESQIPTKDEKEIKVLEIVVFWVI